jgi:hypothetical protein
MTFPRSAALLALSLFITGCPSWVVIKQATPNPFKDQPSIGVEPLSFEGCKVGDLPEPDYRSTMAAARQKKWTNSKEAMVQSFYSQLRNQVVGFSVTPDVAGETYKVIPKITFIEPGNDTTEAVVSSLVKMNAKIVDKNGDILDEIKLRVKVSSTVNEAAMQARLKDAAIQLGDKLASYLTDRVL